MGDFITLTCPSCGGKLDISPGTLTLVCQQCGAEHMIRREAGAVMLESFAMCPVCKRNDQVKKVSTIVAQETQNSNGVTIEKRDYRDSEGRWYTWREKVPFTGKQSSVLAELLLPPASPKHSKIYPPSKNLPTGKDNCLGIMIALPIILISGFGLFILFFELYGAIVGDRKAIGIGQTFIYSIVCISFLLIGIFIFRKSSNNKLTNEERERNERNYELANQKYLSTTKKYELEDELFNKAMTKWRKLYFCSRDDCIFIPGENETAPPSKTIEFVFKEKTRELETNSLEEKIKPNPLKGELKPNPFGFEKKIK